jgi:hypothetical protein
MSLTENEKAQAQFQRDLGSILRGSVYHTEMCTYLPFDFIEHTYIFKALYY